MKITGCVQAGTSASSFELTNVKKGMDHAAPSAAPADAASKNVKLTTAAGVDLAAHVGHTVEVSGSWAKSGDAAASPSASAAPMAKEFTVKNVKMVSSTCSAGTKLAEVSRRLTPTETAARRILEVRRAVAF